MTEPTLLDYLVSTSPQPLQVGTVGRMATGLVNVLAAEAKAVAYCKEILIAMRVGSDAGCLFASTPDAGVNTGKWVQTSAEILPGTSLGLGDGAIARFIYQPRDAADRKIDYDLVFSLAGRVNDALGDCPIAIVETSSDALDGPFIERRIILAAELAPPRFYLQNLVATRVGHPTEPCTEFTAGDAVSLQWESNGTWFQLFKKGDTAPFWAGVGTTATLSGGVTTDTTCILVATMIGDPGQGAETGFRPIMLYDALTVTVSDPELAAQTLTVSGATSLAGVTLSGDLQGPNTVARIAELNCNDANLTGDLRTPGTVAAGTIRTGEIEGDIVFKGSVTFEQDVTFSGTNVFFKNRAIFQTPDGNGNWYLFPSGGALFVMHDQSQTQFILSRDSSFATVMKNVSIKYFFKDDDVINIESLGSTNPLNKWLAYLDNGYQQQVFWVEKTAKTEQDRRVSITHVP